MHEITNTYIKVQFKMSDNEEEEDHSDQPVDCWDVDTTKHSQINIEEITILFEISAAHHEVQQKRYVELFEVISLHSIAILYYMCHLY